VLLAVEDPGMDETQTLHKLLDELDLGGRPEYASVDQPVKLSPQERHFLEWSHDKIIAAGGT
jgi:hypothetical protein